MMGNGRGVVARTGAAAMAWVFGVTVCVGAGCGGGGNAAPGSGSSADTSQTLDDYSSAADELVDRMDDVVRGVVDLQTALDAADDDAVDAALDAQPAQLDAVEDVIERLRSAEQDLNDEQFGEDPQVVQAQALLPALAALAGLAAFAKWLREQNAAANEARMRRDAAANGIDANTPGASDDYTRAQNDLNNVGADVIRRTTTEVVTQLVLSPVEPTSVGGIVIKELAGQAVQEGMTVLTSTPECKQAPPATGCRIGITRTGASGEARAPSGTLTVSISGDGVARTELEDVELLPGEVIEIWIDVVESQDVGSGGSGAGSGAGSGSGSGSDAGSGSGSGGSSGGAGTGSTTPGICTHPDAVGTDVLVQVRVETQADLDALAGCTSVGGLEVPFGTTGITSLAGLESLTEIRLVDDPVLGGIDSFSGQLELTGVDDLTDISALRNLQRVAASVSIDLAGVREVDLSSLQNVGDPQASFTGVSVGGDMIGLIDLGSLERVLGELHFTAENLDTLVLTKLTSLDAPSAGTAGFVLSDADRLAVLELPALTRIDGDLWVYWSEGITAIQAPLLTEVKVDLRFESNTKLTTIGLDSITAPTGGIYISQNTVLESIGLNGIPSVISTGVGLGTGNVTIDGNPVLTTLGMASLTSISGTLSFSLNDALPSETTQAFRDRVSVGMQ
jgi:hypothetical protein